MMGNYAFNSSKYGTHNLVARQIGKNKTVLDVGCNKGYLKKFSDSSNLFYGIDVNRDDLEKAKNNEGYVEIFELNLNDFEEFKLDKKFDVIVFADILEHLLYPEKVLDFFAKKYLKENGIVIISLPNVANFMIRLRLLFGNFDYTEEGILDRTHLHLYTLKSSKKLINECGLMITRSFFSSNRFGKIIKKAPFLGKTLGFNIISICQKKY